MGSEEITLGELETRVSALTAAGKTVALRELFGWAVVQDCPATWLDDPAAWPDVVPTAGDLVCVDDVDWTPALLAAVPRIKGAP